MGAFPRRRWVFVLGMMILILSIVTILVATVRTTPIYERIELSPTLFSPP